MNATVRCLACGQTHSLSEESLATERRVEDAVADCFVLQSRNEIENQITTLQSEVVSKYHWTHYALMLLRYYHESPVDISTHVQWMLGVARYCALVEPQMRWLVDRILFRIGQDLSRCSNPLIRLMASNYQAQCLSGMISRFGKDNPDVQQMISALDALRARRKRIDLTLCSFPHCPSDFEDSDSLPPLALSACARCRIASYCTEECRTMHAEAHELVCECCDALHEIPPF